MVSNVLTTEYMLSLFIASLDIQCYIFWETFCNIIILLIIIVYKLKENGNEKKVKGWATEEEGGIEKGEREEGRELLSLR